MSKTARQDTVWNYDVERIELLTPEGQQSGYFGNRRIDTKEVLGVVSENYQILQNRDLFAQADEVFTKMGLMEQGAKAKHIVTRGGSQARAIYTFDKIGVKVRERDDLVLTLTVANSFDGTLGASFNIGFLRVVCTNGLMAPAGKGTNINKKHTLAVAESFTENKVKHAIEAFHKGAELFKPMINYRLGQQDGRNILGNLAARKVISTKTAKQINEVWESPSYKQDYDRNIWGLYNASTEYLTHEVAPKRFELAQRFTHGIVNSLSRVAAGRDDALIFDEVPEEYAVLN
jgi:hypothetical protein